MNRITAKRKTVQAKTVKLRKNGKHKVDAASTISAPIQLDMKRILRPQAQYRWLMPQLAAITPQYIEMVLFGAMMGNNVQQWELFDIMLKTWPELLACYTELIQGVLRKKLIFEPYCDEDEKPTDSANERLKLVSTALRRMEPDPVRDDCDINDTVKDLLDAIFRGITVQEIVWQMIDDNSLGQIQAPKATFFVHPINYAFDNAGVLGLRPMTQQTGGLASWPFSSTSIQPNPANLDPFPPFKFLIAMCKASAGLVYGGALLRPLAWWWCASNFSSDWLLNLAQVFGLPFRWSNYDPNAPQATIDAICTMLQNMGSAGWAAFPAGTTLELVQPNAQGSDHSPQGELLDRADRYARLLILGQTMTGTHGTTGKGGGQAFGMVEKTVKDDRIEAAGDFATDIINQQLIPMILTLNYGDTEEAPTIKFLEDKEAGLQEAQRDQVLIKAGLEVGVDYLRKKYDIPAPAEGEETIGGAPEMPPGFGGFGGFGDSATAPERDQSSMADASDGASQDMAAGDAPGHEFHGNQYQKFEWTISGRRGSNNVATSWKTDGASIEIQTRKGSVGLGGTRFVATVGDESYASLTFDGAKAWAESKLAKKQIKSGDAPGHPFRGNQYIRLGDEVETPIGRGRVVAGDPFSVFVSVHGDRIRQFRRTDVFKIPRDKSNFPSITHSAENERRAALNMKMDQLNNIEDDALFTKELLKLTEEMKRA